MKHIFSSRSREAILFFIMSTPSLPHFPIVGGHFVLHYAPILFRIGFSTEFLVGLYVGYSYHQN
jgi:hypothetical protein